MSQSLSRTPQTLTLVVLVAITLASWRIGHLRLLNVSAGAVVLVLAFAKVALVVAQFMEVQHAPRWLQLVSAAWIAVACIVLVTLYVAPL